MQAAKIISTFYENNFQNKKVKIPTTYHALDSAVSWFVNTIRFRKCLAFAFFMINNFFTGQTANSCYDNYIYNEWHRIDLEVPIFERYDIIMRYY